MELPAPAAFSLPEFRQDMLQQARDRAATFLALTSHETTSDVWLAGGTLGGEVVVWSLAACFGPRAHQAPALRFSVGHGAVYSLVTTTMGDRTLLLCGTDGGLVGFDWAVLQEEAQQPGPTRCRPLPPLPPLLKFALPQEVAPRGALLPLPECNGLALDPVASAVWLAGGDGCAYGFDLMSMASLSPLTGGHTDYLHAVAVASESRRAFTGGEDGVVGVWDLRTSQGVAKLDPPPEVVGAGAGKWISCLHIIDDAGNWLAVGGGVGSRGGQAERGHLSLWHTPSTSLTSSSQPDCPVHALATTQDDSLLSVGAEPFVRYWSKSRLAESKAQAPTAVACAYAALTLHTTALAELDPDMSLLEEDMRALVAPQDGALALPMPTRSTTPTAPSPVSLLCVAGASSSVDCFTNPSSPSLTLHL